MTTQHQSKSRHSAISITTGNVLQSVLAPTRTAAAVRNAIFSAMALVAPSLQAQTSDIEADTRKKQSQMYEGGAPITLPAVTVKGEENSPYAGEQVGATGRMGFLGNKDFMETPFSTITYTERFIRESQARDIQEIISKSDPTVFISGIAGEGIESYSIRGLRSDVADVTVNGLAGMAAYYRNSPEMFERIEVLKGPSAMLGGMPPRGSAGGAINLVTKRAGDEPLIRLTGTYLSNSHFGGHLDLGSRFGENKQFGIRFNGVYRDGETTIKTQDKKVSQAALALDWRGERARISADLYQSRDRTDALTRGVRLAPDISVPKPPKPDVTWNPPWAYSDSKDRGTVLRGEFDLGDQLTVYGTTGVSKNELNTLMTIPLVFNQTGDFRTNFTGIREKVDRQSMEVGMKGKARTGAVVHQFALNATRYKEKIDLAGFRSLPSGPWATNIYHPVWGASQARPAPIPSIIRTEARLSSIGLADTLSFAEDRAQLTLGVRRQEVISENFNGATGVRMGKRYKESATTPAAAILIKATDQISVYANYIEGLSQGAIAPFTAANAGEAFAPYKTKQKELGIKFDLGKFSHTVSVYEIKRPSSYSDPVTNVFSFGGEQRNRGVEWGFFGIPLHGVKLMGGIAYLNPEVTKAALDAHEGRQAVGIPKWQAKLGAEWDMPAVQGLTLMANATAASRQYVSADNSLSVSGRTVFDLGARYVTKVSGNPLTLQVAVTNVANKAYWANAHYRMLALGAPRTFHLSATMDF